MKDNRITNDEGLDVAHAGSNAMLQEVQLNDKERHFVDKWIKELSDAGYTPDDMIAVFREARRKYEDYLKRKKKK